MEFWACGGVAHHRERVRLREKEETEERKGEEAGSRKRDQRTEGEGRGGERASHVSYDQPSHTY